jgi:hypothetical protein
MRSDQCRFDHVYDQAGLRGSTVNWDSDEEQCSLLLFLSADRASHTSTNLSVVFSKKNTEVPNIGKGTPGK